MSAPEQQLVDIEVAGPRIDVSMLRKNNIRAAVDLRTVDKPGVYTLDVDITFDTANGLQIVYQSVRSVTLTFDEVEEKIVDVTVQTTASCRRATESAARWRRIPQALPSPDRNPYWRTSAIPSCMKSI